MWTCPQSRQSPMSPGLGLRLRSAGALGVAASISLPHAAQWFGGVSVVLAVFIVAPARLKPEPCHHASLAKPRRIARLVPHDQRNVAVRDRRRAIRAKRGWRRIGPAPIHLAPIEALAGPDHSP